MHRNVALALVALSFLAAAPAALAQDVEGSEDHPLITRYEGSAITGYEYREFDEFTLPVGMVESAGGFPSETLEGERTSIMYEVPAGRSPLEVYRNFESALAAAGFETVFECAGAACGDDFGFYVYEPKGGPDELKLPPQNAEEPRYLAARKGAVHVAVFVGGGWYDGPFARIDVIESEAMETDMVTVDAASLYDAIRTEGKAVVRSILFDTGSATIQPASGSTIRAVATLMEEHSDLILHVVGHTDATGSLAGNMTLSERRAEAVVEALATEYGIDSSRLLPHGVGPLAPVAANRTAAGRTENRRVELVDMTTE